MTLRLVESDRWEPRPLRQLPFGHGAFHCFLCGEPVWLVPSEWNVPGASCVACLPCHSRCRQQAGPQMHEQALALASRQRAWEHRAVLN